MAIFNSFFYVCQALEPSLQPNDEEDLAVARLGAPEGALGVGAEEEDVQALGLGGHNGTHMGVSENG